jgi:hypothetical protein
MREIETPLLVLIVQFQLQVCRRSSKQTFLVKRTSINDRLLLADPPTSRISTFYLQLAHAAFSWRTVLPSIITISLYRERHIVFKQDGLQEENGCIS